MRPLVSLTLLSSLLLAAMSAGAATGTTEVVQQRLSDGRILLTDRPVRGATTERSWQVTNSDPAAASQRAAAVTAEANQVSERIQRMIEQDRRADMERERARLEALAMAQQQQRDDEPVYYGGVVPYGYGVGGVGRGHGRFGHNGRQDHVEHHGKFGSSEQFGKVGKLGRPQMFDGR